MESSSPAAPQPDSRQPDSLQPDSLQPGAIPADSTPTPSDEAGDAAQGDDRRRHRMSIAILLVLLAWVYVFNVFIKGYGPVRAFFQILDTISDDFVMGALLTVAAGVGIMVVFSLTKWYSQIVANNYSFAILEALVHDDLRHGRYRSFLIRLVNFRDEPRPERAAPIRVGAVLAAFAMIYTMSCVYVVLFSEALFFVAWSAGVDLPITSDNMLFMPTLALAIPFSARVMASLRYPYAQDYADFMPGAVFVYVLVTALGVLFGTTTQVFFLQRVYADEHLWSTYLLNGVFLSFIPVFFEAVYWIVELNRGGDE